MSICKDLRVGDLVWAKMKGFPAWPARVIEPERPPPSRRFHHNVLFYGTKDHAWILDEQIFPHSEKMLASCGTKKVSPTLKIAVEEITEAAKDYVPRDRTALEYEGKLVDSQGNELSIQEKLAAKYRRLKGLKMQLSKRRMFGSKHLLGKRKRPKAVIQPYDDDEPLEKNKKKKIGFLGLGPMGQRMVANLLKTGHCVTVWNRTPERCDGLVRGGAIRGSNPADVVMASDITLCCLSDPLASKMVLYQKKGVLEGLSSCRRGSKGYVEMTALDGETSQMIDWAVTCDGGRYLEASLGGTCQLGEAGKLLVYGSGDYDLFQECESVFHAIAQHAYLISNQVGDGSNVSLIHSMTLGTVCASLGEAMALADRINIQKKSLLDILEMVGLDATLFKEKGKTMIERHSPTSMPLKNQQQHIDLALNLGHTHFQPMPVVTAANELYKHAKRLGYSKKDSANVFLATKF